MKKLFLAFILLLTFTLSFSQTFRLNSVIFLTDSNNTGLERFVEVFLIDTTSKDTVLTNFLSSDCDGRIRTDFYIDEPIVYSLSINIYTLSGDTVQFNYSDSTSTFYDFTNTFFIYENLSQSNKVMINDDSSVNDYLITNIEEYNINYINSDKKYFDLSGREVNFSYNKVLLQKNGNSYKKIYIKN